MERGWLRHGLYLANVLLSTTPNANHRERMRRAALGWVEVCVLPREELQAPGHLPFSVRDAPVLPSRRCDTERAVLQLSSAPAYGWVR